MGINRFSLWLESRSQPDSFKQNLATEKEFRLAFEKIANGIKPILETGPESQRDIQELKSAKEKLRNLYGAYLPQDRPSYKGRMLSDFETEPIYQLIMRIDRSIERGKVFQATDNPVTAKSNLGSKDNPHKQIAPGITGWVQEGDRKGPSGGLRYYVKGTPANGWITIPPEHRHGTWTGQNVSTNFNNGWETDY